MSKITGGVEGEERGGSESGSGGEAEGGEAREGGLEAGLAFSGGQGGDVGGGDAESGVFDEGREGRRGREEGGARFVVGAGLDLFQKQVAATGEGLRHGESGDDAGGVGARSERGDHGAAMIAVEEADGFGGEVGAEAQERL